MFSEFLIVAISPLLPNLAVYTLNYCIPNWTLSSSTKYSKKSVDNVLLIIFYICVRVCVCVYVWASAIDILPSYFESWLCKVASYLLAPIHPILQHITPKMMQKFVPCPHRISVMFCSFVCFKSDLQTGNTILNSQQSKMPTGSACLVLPSRLVSRCSYSKHVHTEEFALYTLHPLQNPTHIQQSHYNRCNPRTATKADPKNTMVCKVVAML